MPRVFVEQLSTSLLKFYRDKDMEKLPTGGLSEQLSMKCWSAFLHFIQKTDKSSTKTLSMVTPSLTSLSWALMPSTCVLSCFTRILLNV